MTHAIDGFGGNEHSLPIVPLYDDVVQLFAQSKTSYTPTLLVLYGGPWAENYFYETTEVHDDPKSALSDGKQSFTLDGFSSMMDQLQADRRGGGPSVRTSKRRD